MPVTKKSSLGQKHQISITHSVKSSLVTACLEFENGSAHYPIDMSVSFRSCLIATESDKFVFPLLFELAKSYLSDGYHVHLITKSQIQDVPLTINNSQDLDTHSLSRLNIKYLANAEELVEYAINLQFMLSRKGGKPPKAVLIQGLQNYFENEKYGDMALALLSSALKGLSCIMDGTLDLIAGFEVHSNRNSERIVEFVKWIFFSNNWQMNVDGGNGILKKLHGNECQKMIDFKVENDIVFLDRDSILNNFRGCHSQITDPDDNNSHASNDTPILISKTDSKVLLEHLKS